MMEGVFVRGPESMTERIKEGTHLLGKILMLKAELKMLDDNIRDQTHVTVECVSYTISYRAGMVASELEELLLAFATFKRCYPEITYELGTLTE